MARRNREVEMQRIEASNRAYAARRVSVAHALLQTAYTVKTLNGFHAITGARVRCDWSTYVDTMVSHYGCDRASIEALARLGRFHTLDGVTHWCG